MTNNEEDVRDFIRKNYADVASKGSEGGCCGGSCSFKFFKYCNIHLLNVN